MNPINKIIKRLENTKLGFTTGALEFEGLYCAEGILAYGIIPSDDLEKYDDLSEACHDDEIYSKKLKTKYGIDFEKRFKQRINCDFCEDVDFGSLSQLITHYNDQHSTSHKQVAEHLKALAEVYDLIKGKPLDKQKA